MKALNQWVIIDNSFQNSNAIVKKFIENGTNFGNLQEYFKNTRQHISILFFAFFKYYTRNNKFGVQNKLRFTLHFKEGKDSKKIKRIIRAATVNEIPMNDLMKLSKEPQNYNWLVNKFEQKPINVDNKKFVLTKKTIPTKKTLNFKGKAQFDARKRIREGKKKC